MKKEKIIAELAKEIEYHPSHDIGLDQVSRIKQEMGLALLARFSQSIDQLLELFDYEKQKLAEEIEKLKSEIRWKDKVIRELKK